MDLGLRGLSDLVSTTRRPRLPPSRHLPVWEGRVEEIGVSHDDDDEPVAK